MYGQVAPASRLTLLVAAFAGLFLVFCATTWHTVDQVRVQGNVYEQIVSGKDLIADVLPPPEYIIEAYLVAHQFNDETDPSRLSELVEHGDKLRVDYESRQEFWRRELPQNPLKDPMTVTAYRSAIRFFQLRDEQFIPAIRAGDHERAKAVLAQTHQSYEAHRLAINQVVQLATRKRVPTTPCAQRTNLISPPVATDAAAGPRCRDPSWWAAA